MSDVSKLNFGDNGGDRNVKDAVAREKLTVVDPSAGSGLIQFGVDANGNYGYKKVGADTVIPFKSGNNEFCKTLIMDFYSNSSNQRLIQFQIIYDNVRIYLNCSNSAQITCRISIASDDGTYNSIVNQEFSDMESLLAAINQYAPPCFAFEGIKSSGSDYYMEIALKVINSFKYQYMTASVISDSFINTRDFSYTANSGQYLAKNSQYGLGIYNYRYYSYGFTNTNRYAVFRYIPI